MCIDAYVIIRSYVLCVRSLITRLQLKKMSVMYESVHDAITFHLLEMSSITTSNQKQLRIFAQGTLFKGFFRENIGNFTKLHNGKKKLVWKLPVNGIVLVTGTRVNVYQIL